MSITGVNFNYLLKFIIIGDSGVGKSNILLRYTRDKFNEEFQSTIGVEFGVKNLQIEDKIYRVQIWDTAGQQNFRSVTRAYYKNSVCACVVYDITSKKTFESIKSWIEDCRKQCPKTILLVLIGNKVDLENEREVSYEEGADFAKQYEMFFYETSAKTGKNIDEVFIKTTNEIAKKIGSGFYDLNNDNCGIKQGFSTETINLGSNNNSNEKNQILCC